MKNLVSIIFIIGTFQLYAQHDTLSVTATYVDPSLFDDSELLVGWQDTYCAVAVDGQDTTFAPCYIVTYRDHYNTSIELCPDNLDEVGGIGLFNGDPRLLDRSLFEDMEADGSDIIGDDNFTVNYLNLTTGEKVGSGKYCVEAELYEGTTNTWFQTFQILKGPVTKPGNKRDYHTAETIGVLKNGMVLEHTPPSSESSAAMVGGIIPIDYCGWHPEPAGFGHFHAIPYGIDVALEANGIASDYFCADLDQGSGSAFVGFTFEGLPIYGPKDADGTIPTDLDECNGHEGSTTEFPNGAYHYHASATDIINNPPCYTYYLPLEDSRFTYGEWTSSAPATPGEISGLSSVCSNESAVTYSIVAVATATSYNWTVPSGATITAGTGTNNITVDFGSSVGDVCVNAQNSTGSSNDQCLTITAATCDTTPDTPGTISGLAEICTGDAAIVYSIAAVTSATTYNWTVPSDATITAGDGTTSITVTFGSEVGEICVNAENSTGTSANQCLTIAASTSCASAPESPGTISGLEEICANQTGVEYSISAVAGATTYNWTIPTGATITAGDGTVSITVTFGNEVGEICVNAENSVGTSSNKCLTIAASSSCESAPDTPGAISGLSEVCPNETNVAYSIVAVATATSYNWTVPSGATITAGSGTINITVDFGSSVGNVCVNAQNATGSSTDQCLTITAATCDSAPDTPGNISGLAEVCADDAEIVYSIAAVTSADTYNWTVPSDATITAGEGTTSITVTFGSEVGEICVNAENSTGTSANQCLTITASSSCAIVPERPGTISGLEEICANQTGVEYNISAVAGATTYNWNVPMGASITQGQGTTDITVTFGAVAAMVCVNAENSAGTSPDRCLTTSLCQVTAINDNVLSAKNLKIFPNPASTEELTIEGDYDKYTIFDINGTTVLESSRPNALNKTTIKLPELRSGIYFIKAQKGNTVLFERIILQEK